MEIIIIYKDDNQTIIKTNIYGIVIIEKKINNTFRVFSGKKISQDHFNEIMERLKLNQ